MRFIYQGRFEESSRKGTRMNTRKPQELKTTIQGRDFGSLDLGREPEVVRSGQISV